MTKKQGGIGRHGYGTKYKKKPAHLAGENGQQAAARIAAEELVGLSAPQPASAARRAPATKPAGQPNAR